MISTLSDNTLLELYQYIHIKDVLKIKRLNKTLYNRIQNIEGYIVSQELRRAGHRGTYNEKKQSQTHLELALKNTLSCCIVDVFYNNCLNHMFNNMLTKYEQTYTIPHSITSLITIPNILQMSMCNTKNHKYLIDFIYNNMSFNAYNVIVSYYTVVLQNITVSFENLYKISKHAVTLKSLKKLFGYKPLDLSLSTLIDCCDTCKFDIIKHMVQFRYNRQNDDVLAHNYNVIKQFLKQHATRLYNQMNIFEERIIDTHLKVLCPTTNTPIRYKSKRYNTILLTTFEKYTKARIQKGLHKQRKQLHEQYFN